MDIRLTPLVMVVVWTTENRLKGTKGFTAPVMETGLTPRKPLKD